MDIWVEVEVTVLVTEKCLVVIKVKDLELETLDQQIESAIGREVPKLIQKDDNMKLSSVKCSKVIKKYYPDLKNKPNVSCPIDKNIIEELLDGNSLN